MNKLCTQKALWWRKSVFRCYLLCCSNMHTFFGLLFSSEFSLQNIENTSSLAQLHRWILDTILAFIACYYNPHLKKASCKIMPILAIQHRYTTITTKNDYMLKLCHFRPPPGCLQYLFGSEGTLQTFNFASGNGHLLDQDYSICIRQETGLYTLSWRTS